MPSAMTAAFFDAVVEYVDDPAQPGRDPGGPGSRPVDARSSSQRRSVAGRRSRPPSLQRRAGRARRHPREPAPGRGRRGRRRAARPGRLHPADRGDPATACRDGWRRASGRGCGCARRWPSSACSSSTRRSPRSSAASRTGAGNDFVGLDNYAGSSPRRHAHRAAQQRPLGGPAAACSWSASACSWPSWSIASATRRRQVDRLPAAGHQLRGGRGHLEVHVRHSTRTSGPSTPS